MAACCAIGAFIIWKFMSIYQNLAPTTCAPREAGIIAPDSQFEAEHTLSPTRTCRLSLTGLTCHGCVNIVKSSLDSAPGLVDASVSFQSLSAYIRYRPSETTTVNLIKRIQETGYGVTILAESDDLRSTWLNASISRKLTIEDQKSILKFSVATTGVVFAFETLIPWMTRNTTTATICSALSLFLTLLAVVVLAQPIHRDALNAMRRQKLSSTLLSSLGLIAVLCSAVYERMIFKIPRPDNGDGEHTLTSTCLLMATINGSRMIKGILAKQSSQFATNLAQALPQTAEVVSKPTLDDIDSSLIPVELLQPSDYVLVRPNSPFPADGNIVCGKSTAGRIVLTGELSPELVEAGSLIYAGCMNGGGRIIAKVVRTGKRTLLSQALDALSQAQEGRKTTDPFADRYLAWFSSFTLCFAAILGISQLRDDVAVSTVLSKIATVLLCACPCALGVGIPICFMIATANAHSLGIIMKPGHCLARAGKARAVVFDKTGTLTKGEVTVEDVVSFGAWEEPSPQTAMLWQAVEDLCRKSQHPVSKLLLKVALKQIGDRPRLAKSLTLSSFEERLGLGLLGTFSAQTPSMKVAIGNTRLMQTQNVYFAPASRGGNTPSTTSSSVYISVNGQLAVRALYCDLVRPDAKSLVEALHRRDLETFIMTGDTSDAALSIANEIGVKAANVYSSLLPSDKAERIVRLERRLGPVIMVGDNVNDGPALFASTLGVALHSGDSQLDGGLGHDPLLASLRADVDAFLLPTLPTSTSAGAEKPAIRTRLAPTDFLRFIYLVDLLRETDRCLQQVKRWSFFYNILALTLAGGVLVPLFPAEFAGVVSLTPAQGSLAMATSSTVSLLFCFRLQDWRPDWCPYL